MHIASNQIKLTKEIADANRRRESVKLAGEQCKYFGEQVVPAMVLAMRKHREQNCTFLDQAAAPAVAIYYLRTTQGSRWSSVLKLFEIWDRSDRSPSNRIRPSGRAENGGGRQE